MRTIRRAVKINLPAEQVFGMLANSANERHWMFGVTGSERRTPGPLRRGTEMICKFGFGPITTVKMDAVIDEFEPGRRFVRRRVGGAMAMKGELVAEPNGTVTNFGWTMEVGLKVPVIGPLLDPLLAAWMNMSMALSMNKFKALAESKRIVPNTAEEMERVPNNS